MKKTTMLFFATLITMFTGSSIYAQYCVPEGTNSARYINNFSTTSGSQNISNLNSGFSTGGYADFTSLTVEQGLGGAINFSVNVEGGTAGLRIWIDWNQDGLFDVTNEVAYQSTGYSSTPSGSFAIPGNAIIGTTRMRVVSHWLSQTGLVDPCATGFTYGEFEDYSISVTADISYDCPALSLNIGAACDDGNPNTINDAVNADCDCVGIPTATNDEACTATTLSCGDTIVQSLSGATSSLTDACFGSGTADVWFSFINDGTQIVTVTENSAFDAVVQLFKGDACGNLVEAGACQDSPENYTVTEAGTYYFRVRPYFSSANAATISVSLTCVDYDCPITQLNFGDACDDGDGATINDIIRTDCNCAGELPNAASFCDGAIPVVCNADPETYSSGASIGTNTTSCSMGDKGLWFSFMGTGGEIIINSSATFDHRLSVNRGSCTTLTNIVCQDNSVAAENYTIASSVLGEMYYLYIARYNSGSTITGDITINIVCATPPACIAPSLALTVQDVDGNAITDCLDFGSSYYVLATLSGGEGNTSYNLTGNGGTTVEVDADGAVVLGPFNAGTNVSVIAVGVQDDDCNVTATANSPSVCGPVNDNCENAIALSCNGSVSGSTLSASESGLSSPTCAGGTPADVFYSLDVEQGIEYTVTVVGDDYDGVLAIYSGACGSLIEIYCADNGFSAGVAEIITFTATTTETVTIRTYDWSSSRGSFTMSAVCNPLSVNENNTLANSRLYPNPLNNGTFYIYAPQLNGERVEVNITDVAGRQIFNDMLVGSDNKVTVSVNDALSTGMYLVTLKHAGQMHTFRLVKE